MLLKLATATHIRISEITSLVRRDRGEGPVPYIVMVALVAFAAAAIAAAIYAFADSRADDLDAVPDRPF